MRFYIADDDINVVRMLSNLIYDDCMGDVVGSANDGESALEDILKLQPDIALMDFLMPKKDGGTVLKEATKQGSKTKFIFISQVSDKNMIADTYSSGSEFFITKPLNSIEIKRVIGSIKEKIELEKTIKNIRKILGKNIEVDLPDESIDPIAEIKKILSHVGILGEKGSYDILKVCEFILEDGNKDEPLNITSICRGLGENPKIMKQRIRRSVYSGLANVAHSGIEDYMNDYFVKYSGSLYDFENVKAEMDHIRGKRKSGGKVNLEKFIENLILQSEVD